jgi:hypothetical protein
MLTEFTEIVRSEILLVEQTAHSAVIQLASLNLNITVRTKECFGLTDFLATCVMHIKSASNICISRIRYVRYILYTE